VIAVGGSVATDCGPDDDSPVVAILPQARRASLV
jgi:hypothetical protein